MILLFSSNALCSEYIDEDFTALEQNYHKLRGQLEILQYFDYPNSDKCLDELLSLSNFLDDYDLENAVQKNQSVEKCISYGLNWIKNKIKFNEKVKNNE